MKKLGVLILCIIFVIVSGCTVTIHAETDKSEENAVVTGGWTVVENQNTNLQEEVKQVFDKAMDQYTEEKLEAVAMLGTQVVAGTNYAFLCQSESPAGWKVAIIYQDLQDNCEVLKVSELNIAAIKDSETEETQETLAGGWSVSESAAEAVSLDEASQNAFDKAMEGLLGVGYEPVVLLGTQVVAGTNYAFLCKSTTVTAEPLIGLKVVFIYEDLQGAASVDSIVNINIADYNG